MEENFKNQNILGRDLVDEMEESYLSYAMSVIISRALPDVRDGLKPVHRRVLFGASGIGAQWNRKHKKSARIVGYAMNASHTKDVPAHRVVNRKGLLTGKHHFEGTNLMQQLLENEGVEIVENQIQNLEAIYWDPSKELI